MAEEEWIWGNHRGGGGAPVYTETGETVTNLRQVARGNVQIDKLSPNARRKMRDQRFEDGYDGRDRDGGGGDYRSRHSSSNEYDDSKDRHDNQRDSPSRHPVNNASSSFTSPSHRGARKNMFVSDAERMERVRKAKQYQESLREQVEEKRREKERQEREKKDLKKKEYDEYMSQHFKGKVRDDGYRRDHSPVANSGHRGVQNSPPRYNENGYGHNSSREQYSPPHYGRTEQRTSPRGGRREQPTPPREGRREQPTPPRRGYREHGTPPRRNRREQTSPPHHGRREQPTPPRRNGREQATPPENGRRDQPPRFRNQQHDRCQSDRNVISPITNEDGKMGYRNVLAGRRQGLDEDWVSKVEYEELSALCKGLLKQQQELEKQLEQQNHIIQDLQSGNIGVNGTQAAAKRAPRARNGVGNNRQVAKVSQVSPIGKKMSARQSAALAAAEKKKKPKVSLGFGSRIETAKEKERRERRERIAANAIRSQSHSGSRNNKEVLATEKQERPNSMKVSGGRGAGVGGFKKLQARVDAADNGPKVITYEDDYGGGGTVQSSPNKVRRSQGQGGELKGASDLLYIQGSDVDRISEDQLDKLLGKARGAR